MSHGMPTTLRALVAIAALTVFAHAAHAQTTEPATAHAHGAVIEVGAEDYAFRVPAEITAGWNTFRFTNEGEEHHFMYLSRLPEGRTFDEYVTGVMVPFDEGWALMRDGELGPEEGVARIMGSLPEWFAGVVPSGGTGLVAPGRTAEVTLYLEPGSYVFECYMKTPEGEFHAVEGMTDPLTVTAGPATGGPPTPDVRLSLANYEILVEGEVSAGRNVIEVRYADQPEGLPGHDVHLLRMDDEADPQDVARWMNWVQISGLAEPAPGTFIGGVNTMLAGSTAYFTVDLEPGRYLFVSEYTGAMGVLKEFRVER